MLLQSKKKSLRTLHHNSSSPGSAAGHTLALKDYCALNYIEKVKSGLFSFLWKGC